MYHGKVLGYCIWDKRLKNPNKNHKKQKAMKNKNLESKCVMYYCNACIVMYLAPHYLFFCYVPWWQNSEQRKVSADTSTCTVWTVLVYRTVQLTIQHSKLPFYKWRGNGGVPGQQSLIVFLSVFKKIVFLCCKYW